ncbi:MAG TPA: permease [Myxococcota bacterium]|nr:permease [Myxococcota bacterium]
METFFSHLWNTTAELAPWLLLGLAIAGLFHAVLPAGLVARSLRGKAGVFKAVGIGVPLPLCSCGVIPAGIGLKKDGASSGAAVGFLIATPQTGVDSILVSASMLGWPFALVKVGAALVTGLVGGLLVERTSPTTPSAGPLLAGPTQPLATRLRKGAGHSVEVFRSIWRWLAFGVLMSAALMTLVTPGSLASAFGDSWFLASLAVLAVAIPTYVCATGSVPIAAALVAGGLPLPAALVFLMAGPATSIATIGTVHKHFGRKVTALYLGTIIVGSLTFAWLFDTTLGGLAAHAHHHEHGGLGWLSYVFAGVLVAAMAWFAVQEVRSFIRGKRTVADETPRLELEVSGMTCNGCVMGLERALSQVAGVEKTEVVLDGGKTTVLGRVERQAVVDAVRRAGFEVVKSHGG